MKSVYTNTDSASTMAPWRACATLPTPTCKSIQITRPHSSSTSHPSSPGLTLAHSLRPITPTNGVSTLKPWYINYLGGEWNDATQCMGAGDNGWGTMHSAYNGGLANNWAGADGGYALGYFKRQDIPTHWDIVEGWTVMDMSSQSILAATDPNRITWMSGSVNIPGSPTNPDGKGGMIIDNNASPGTFFAHAYTHALTSRLRVPRPQLLPICVEDVPRVPRGRGCQLAGVARLGQL